MKIDGWKKAAIAILLSVVALWITAPYWPWGDIHHLDNLFSPVNALFSALAFVGLIITIYLQSRGLELQREELKATRDELHATAEANQTIVSDSKVTALINLYLFFYDGSNFGKTREKASFVLHKMIEHEDYYHYIFGRWAIAARGYENVSERHQHQFQKIYSPNSELDFDTFKQIDSEHRDKFFDLLNFFNLLSVRSIPKEYYQKVDFNYAQWRQILWWYAFRVEAEFYNDMELKKFCTKIALKDSLVKLDDMFDFESPSNLQDVFQFPTVRDLLKRKAETTDSQRIIN